MKKKITSVLLGGVILAISTVGFATPEQEQIDIVFTENNIITSSWSREYIYEALDEGLLDNSRLSNNVNMTTQITREDFVDIMMNYLRKNTTELEFNNLVNNKPPITFTDTTNINIINASRIGFVSGMGDGKFYPNNILTRQELSSLVDRVEKILTPRPLNSRQSVELRPFIDKNLISDWAKQSVSNLVANNMINGITSNSFEPLGKATKEQAIKIMIVGNRDKTYRRDPNRLVGKRLSMIGDSIVNNNNKINTKEVEGRFIGYQSILGSTFGFSGAKERNISGATISINKSPYNESLVSHYANDNYNDTDYLVVAGGTNDFKLDIPIGNISELSSTNKNLNTFYGAYGTIIEKAKLSNSNLKIQLWTPLKRNNDGYTTTSRNKAGYQLNDYRQAIIKIAEYYNVEVVDMYSHSGIEENNLSIYTTDGLHLNNDGYYLATKHAIKFINEKY